MGPREYCEDDGRNGGDYYSCRMAIARVENMSQALLDSNQKLWESNERLSQVLDHRLGQFIDLMDQRLNNPWGAINRMIILVGACVLAFIGFVFAHEHGIKNTENLIESIKR